MLAQLQQPYIKYTEICINKMIPSKINQYKDTIVKIYVMHNNIIRITLYRS